jgi:prepilin-type N-terminal cleavage/methylation domain-containing protein
MKINSLNNAGSKAQRDRAGFTLIEVAFAAAIAALVLAGMFQGYNMAGRRSQYSACSLAANTVASRQLEEVISADWQPNEGITTLLGMGGTTSGNLDLPSSQGNTVNCTIVTTVNQISSSPPYAMIEVDCIWTNPCYGGVYTNTVSVIRASNQ